MDINQNYRKPSTIQRKRCYFNPQAAVYNSKTASVRKKGTLRVTNNDVKLNSFVENLWISIAKEPVFGRKTDFQTDFICGELFLKGLITSLGTQTHTLCLRVAGGNSTVKKLIALQQIPATSSCTLISTNTSL